MLLAQRAVRGNLVLVETLVRRRFVRDGEAPDAQVGADAVDHEERPAEVDDHGEGRVGAQVPQFRDGADGWETESGEVGEDGATEERHEHDGPVGERLAREVGEDDLGRHAAEDEGHGGAEEHKVVVAQERRPRRVQPSACGADENDKGSPFEEDRRHGKRFCSTDLDNVVHTRRHVRYKQGDEEDGYPVVDDRRITEYLGPVDEVGDA